MSSLLYHFLKPLVQEKSLKGAFYKKQTWPPQSILVSDWLISKKYLFIFFICLLMSHIEENVIFELIHIRMYINDIFSKHLADLTVKS
jgi:hypothetical protein